MTASARDPGKPPDATLIHARWVKAQDREWAEDCNRIMMEYGSVHGETIYNVRHKARQRARRLIDLMVSLRMHARWELVEHTEHKQGGYEWSVHYKGGR